MKQTRSGWENEHLASFLLSQFSFLSHPLTVADDLGVDFLCTLFEPKTIDNQVQLFPKQAFAIQIKSSPDPVEVEGRLAYLRGLEVPFFLGVVDQPKASLSIYSGELLPEFFASTEANVSMRLDAQESSFDYAVPRNWLRTPAGKFKVPMPLVETLRIGAAASTFEQMRQLLLAKCETMLRNISARISCEYIFQYPQPPGSIHYQIIAGRGSNATFRTNLMLRLAESFYNLKWIFANSRSSFDRAEFDELERCFIALKAKGYPVQGVVQPLYEDLRDALARENANDGQVVCL